MLELFCGIGGCATALAPALEAGEAEVVAAVDINPLAMAAYSKNFSHPRRTGILESIPLQRFASWAADLWWMSPPCQPFTRRGLRRDRKDPRTRPLLALTKLLLAIRPRYAILENVPGFEESQTRRELTASLDAHGYRFREILLCPSRLGIPNRRQRYYLLAWKPAEVSGDLETCGLSPEGPRPPRPLQSFLDPSPAPDLRLEPATQKRYEGALHIVDSSSPTALTTCFTAAYGRSPVRSGSYLATKQGARRFSPEEILRLLGFPAHFRFPAELSRNQRWRLAGNSLSIPAARLLLGAIPELPHCRREPRDCAGLAAMESRLECPQSKVLGAGGP